ncbi:efflux RND transporter permease subunit [Halodesulfovibrio marinisediminis]|uniref:Multidrug efflux pump subunit AcrB n=1 Tax=Halodesulfovibrio marinisediminis DSM 17456 TaxID=1121457 RepID=A0A1N6FIX0_9BACT|nr:efflux RND transporter permease subunit [Halodesulfovibrio marinisediminis]SIN95241.1 Multidrug efflux pump subunit AcrB [Halodesulfovibrio marinisediminis DSM 17456]
MASSPLASQHRQPKAPLPEQPRGAVAWMAGNSVAANLLMLVLLIGGLVLGSSTTQEVFPEIELDSVSVTVSYPGASPEEIERSIVQAVEESIEGIEGIEDVTSTANENSATIRAELLDGADVDRVWQDIKTEVDRITTFPDEAEDPRITIDSRKRSVLTLVVSGNVSELVLRDYANQLEDALLRNPNITQADITGVRDLETHVEISRNTLRKYNITLTQVADQIRKASVELGGGSLKTAQGEILVRVTDRKLVAKDFEQIPILTDEYGASVYLGDIANIWDGFEDTDAWSSFDGNRAVSVEVYRIGSQTPMSIATAALNVVDEFKEDLPPGVTIGSHHNRYVMFQDRADLLLRNAYIGLGLVFIFLALFLEIRLAFWVSLGIPISFLGAFVFLPFTDFSINMITMFAFIITLGIVVDDAIVVGENVYYHRNLGKSRLQAAIDGAKEVMVPVTFSVITNIITFMPLYFVPGTMGKIFKYIPVVVGIVFFISLIESIFILPAHLAHGSERSRIPGLSRLIALQQRFSNRFEHFIAHQYGNFISKLIGYRFAVLGTALAILFITVGFALSGRLGMVLFPTVDSDYAYGSVTMPYGTPVSRIKEVEKQLVDAANAVIANNGGDKLSTGILTTVNTNKLNARIYLTQPDVRPVSTPEVTAQWRNAVGTVLGAEAVDFVADKGGPGSGKGVTIQLSHRDNTVLEQAATELAEAMALLKGVSDIDDGNARGKRQFDIKLLPAGEAAGLSSREIATQLRNAFYGAEAVKQQVGQDEVTVRVRLPKEERASVATFDNLVLTLPNGGEMLLRDAAQITRAFADTSITRENSKRIRSVTGNVTPRKLSEQVIASVKSDILPDLLRKYSGLNYSLEGKQADMRDSIQSLIKGLLLTLLAIYALLAIPFKSYIQPLIVLLAIPFGMVGAVVGHLIMGYSLSLMSMFGLVALAGVVVNDSLVLVDFTNRLRREGYTPTEAVVAGAIKRFRPILLTTITTCCGLAPMILETSRQARFLIPMAISLGFGILFATIITLLLVPCFYLVFEDVTQLVSFKTSRVAQGTKQHVQ